MEDPKIVEVRPTHAMWKTANDDDWGTHTFHQWVSICAVDAEVHLEIPPSADAATVGLIVTSIARVARRCFVKVA